MDAEQGAGPLRGAHAQDLPGRAGRARFTVAVCAPRAVVRGRYAKGVTFMAQASPPPRPHEAFLHPFGPADAQSGTHRSPGG